MLDIDRKYYCLSEAVELTNDVSFCHQNFVKSVQVLLTSFPFVQRVP